MGDVRATATPILTELLLRVRDLYGTADPVGMPLADNARPRNGSTTPSATR
jgi:hypothetical protein